MLEDVDKLYSFVDLDGEKIDLEKRQAIDQYKKVYKDFSFYLTSIILISAERGDYTKRCVENIFKYTPEPFEIIISDVGSSDETKRILEQLKKSSPNIHIICNQKSTGTTGQRNQGIHVSKGGLLVFMDNDVLALPNWLKPLRKVVQDNQEIGAVGAKLLKPDGNSVYYCGAHAVTLEKGSKIYGIGLDKEEELSDLKKDDPVSQMEGNVPWYSTTTLLVRRDVVYLCGGFDDLKEGKGIFIANEDKDLCLSIRGEGFKIWYSPESETIHNHDYSKVNRKDKYHKDYRLRMDQIENDTLYFMKKWNLTYLLEKLPHEDNTKKLEKGKLVPFKIDLLSVPYSGDLVRLK
ncbi:MAG: hypothetical protein AMJ90_02550 [candidate division Zixibacteria bacterium SM23_73_2]|nr:MAG: hypothetical protein AMJ90_02550 [candidate division Zixibacteria bacterium SM23_73_2]